MFHFLTAALSVWSKCLWGVCLVHIDRRFVWGTARLQQRVRGYNLIELIKRLRKLLWIWAKAKKTPWLSRHRFQYLVLREWCLLCWYLLALATIYWSFCCNIVCSESRHGHGCCELSFHLKAWIATTFEDSLICLWNDLTKALQWSGTKLI